MSERADLPTPEGEYVEANRFAPLSFLLAIVGIVGLGLSVVGAFVSPKQFSYSWLFAFAFYFTILAGCFFWIVAHHVVDAEWSVVVRRQLENLAMLLAVMVVFITPTLLFRRFSIRQDRDGNPAFTINMRRLAFVSLPLFAFSITFGAYDWLLGIDYHWFSTMWGVYIFAGAAGSSMSLLVLVITALRKAGYLKETVTPEHYHIMGKWMLAFCVFWAYIGFSQYMLIWYANIPEETQYFLARNTESWWLLSTFLVVGRFFGPFAILLLRSIKKRPHQLCWVAGWIVGMQMLDMYIIILPALHGTGVHLSIWDFVPLIGMGATLAFVFLRIVGRPSLFPMRDPRLVESLKLVN